MSTQPPLFQRYSPGVMSLLPLFYVGWADSVLSPSEINLIRKKIRGLPFLTKEDKAILKEWGNPKNPPSPEQFKHWVTLIKKTAEQMPSNQRSSLAQLGLEMAKRTATEEEVMLWNSLATKNALADLEAVLGVESLETYRNIFTAGQREKEVAEILNQPSFDIAQMTTRLDDDYTDIRNRMRNLLADPAFHYETLRDKYDYRNKVLEWCKLLANQGLGALAYPKAHGGADDMGAYIAVFEMLGYHDLSLAIKFGVQFGLFGGSIQNLGTEQHHQKYLKAVGTCELLGCFAMTETGHGSNVRGLKTTATYDKSTDEIIINTPTEEDGKEYIGNALHGRMASVFAQLIVNGENHGVHAVLVPYRDLEGNVLEGIRVEDNGYKLGLNGVDNGRIWFNQVRVPRKNLLNRFGNIDEHGNYTSPIESPAKRFFTMLGTLVGGRVSVPRTGLSAAKSGLTIAIKYALKRRQFAPNPREPETLLLDYPSHQRRLMPLLAKTYALDFALTYLTKRYNAHTEKDIREIESLAAGLKSYATWFTTETLQACREACGGKGYLAENRFADLKADTDIFTTFEGDNTVLMQLVAKGLLSDFRQAFHDGGYLAVMRFLGSQFKDYVAENNVFTARSNDKDHLCDTAFHLAAFQYRERANLVSVGQRMQGLIKKRMNPYDAYLRCQTHLLVLAEAYIERIVLQQFAKAVQAEKDGGIKKQLKKMCDLYALSTIEKNKGWYLEQGYMSGRKTKGIRRMVDKLCKSLRGDAGFLVDAFAIPKSCLGAKIV
ncbi:MAG: acyl-CoA dehydrogenase [Bacteroidota bacterium]